MSSSALIVLDFINDIAHLKGKIARSAERIEKNQVIQKANQAIAHARKKHYFLIFVKVGFHPGYLECPKESPLFGAAEQQGALLLGAWGTEFHEKLDFRETDLVVIKHRVNAFYSTPLEAILRARHIQHLLVTGTATNMAVEHAAREAHDRDYLVTILQDACETATEEAHRAALENMRRFCKVITVSQFHELNL
ncbi:MAG TPA: cysteine hydrolase [Rhabdochlamydiaceae bacterium]|jgi:nicotinamidase-related amidase